MLPSRSRAGRAVERYDVTANTQEMLDHYRTRISVARQLAAGFSLSAFFFSITSEVILFGFFWGATIINKVLAVTFYLLGV